MSSPPTKKEPIEQAYYVYEQAGQYIGQTTEVIKKLVQKGILKKSKVAGRNYIARTALDKMMKDGEV